MEQAGVALRALTPKFRRRAERFSLTQEQQSSGMVIKFLLDASTPIEQCHSRGRNGSASRGLALCG